MTTSPFSEKIWYIPGWLRTEAPVESVMAIAARTFPQTTPTFKSWDGDHLVWPLAVANADKEVWRFAFEIAMMPPTQRARLTLIGHSLGGRIVARILARLAEHNLRIRQAVLMGAAIPAEDPDLATAGLASELPVLAVCNPEDVTLRYIYALAGGENDVAFGANGSLHPYPNLVEHVVPSSLPRETDLPAAWAKITRLKELANHHEHFYFEYLRRLFSGEAPAGEIMVPQGLPSLPQRVADSEVWWNVLEQNSGWKLEQHLLTGHCRILNPGRVRTAWGSERKMRLAFDKVKRQLRS